MKPLLSGLVIIFFLLFGIFQLVVGYLGIEYHIGAGWAVAALACVFVFRSAFPITIGTYFGCVDVLGWHWTISLLFTLPGLLFLIPMITLTTLEYIKSHI